MANYQIENVLERCERVREAYATVAQQVNNDPRRTFQARRDDLAGAWETATGEIDKLRAEYAQAVATERQRLRSGLVPYRGDAEAVRRAMAQLETATPEDFARQAQIARDLGDVNLTAALRFRALDDPRLAEHLDDVDRTVLANALNFEAQYGHGMDADRRFEINGFALGKPDKVQPLPPVAPAQTGGGAFSIGGGQAGFAG